MSFTVIFCIFLCILIAHDTIATTEETVNVRLEEKTKYLIFNNDAKYLLLGKQPLMKHQNDLFWESMPTDTFKELVNDIRQQTLAKIAKDYCDVELDTESPTKNPINTYVLFQHRYEFLSQKEMEDLFFKIYTLSPTIFNKKTTLCDRLTNAIVLNYGLVFQRSDESENPSIPWESESGPVLPLTWIDISSIDAELLKIIFTNDVWTGLYLFGSNVDYNYILSDASPKDKLVLYDYNIEYGSNEVFPGIIVKDWITIVCVLPKKNAMLDLTSIKSMKYDIIVHFRFPRYAENTIKQHQHVTVTINKNPGISVAIFIDEDIRDGELLTVRVIDIQYLSLR